MQVGAAAGEAERAQEDVDGDLRLLAHLRRGDGGNNCHVAALGHAAERHDVDRDAEPLPRGRHLVELLGVADPAVRDDDDGRRGLAAEPAGQLPQRRPELRVGVVRRGERAGGAQRREVDRDEPLAEAVDAQVGVAALEFDHAAE